MSSRATIQLGQHKLRLLGREMCHFRAEDYSETADRSGCDARLQNSAQQSRRDSKSIAAARRKDNRNRPCDISPRPAIEGDRRVKRDQKVGSWNLHECAFPRLRGKRRTSAGDGALAGRKIQFDSAGTVIQRCVYIRLKNAFGDGDHVPRQYLERSGRLLTCHILGVESVDHLFPIHQTFDQHFGGIRGPSVAARQPDCLQ